MTATAKRLVSSGMDIDADHDILAGARASCRPDNLGKKE